jgi:Tfp pilus assembly protein PilV
MEVMVALIVLSIAVVAALQLFGGGLRLARAAASHQEATLLASEKLSELGLEDLQEGSTEGTEGDYRWTRQVTFDDALQPEELDPTAAVRVRLARLSVDVRWGRNRHVELVTLRIVIPKPS